MDPLQDHIRQNRHHYDKHRLLETDLTDTPFELLTLWLKVALEEGVYEPIAMNLATVDEGGNPSSRIVLMRGFDENGIVFYTNYNSRKGRQISARPSVALNFYWHELNKQIRIEGKVQKINPAISDEYFSTRPRESQLGAWASEQSSTIKDRKELDERFFELAEKFKDQPVPRPPHWGGYLVIPHLFEFWQGRPDRMHDRFQYIMDSKSWKVSRLSP